MRSSVGAAAVVLLAVAGAGCYSTMPVPQAAKLRVVAQPDTTTVYIDDHYIGTARVLAVRPKTLSPGVKFITFKAPNYFPHDVKVDLPSGTTTIEMKLRPIPP
jgi:hypothetical protein